MEGHIFRFASCLPTGKAEVNCDLSRNRMGLPGSPMVTSVRTAKDEWLRRLRYAVTASDLVVSVDTNTLNWLRATWPGYEHKQVYIPNFVDGNEFFPPGETEGTENRW